MRLLLTLVLVALAPVGAQQRLSERDSTLTIFFMDVGQGDATWIVTGRGRQVLIDAGRSRRVIEPHLWENADTFDLVVASHNHMTTSAAFLGSSSDSSSAATSTMLFRTRRRRTTALFW